MTKTWSRHNEHGAKNWKSFFNEFYQEIVIVEVKILSTCNFWSVFRDFFIEKSLLSDRSGKEVLNWKKKTLIFGFVDTMHMIVRIKKEASVQVIKWKGIIASLQPKKK